MQTAPAEVKVHIHYLHGAQPLSSVDGLLLFPTVLITEQTLARVLTAQTFCLLTHPEKAALEIEEFVFIQR